MEKLAYIKKTMSEIQLLEGSEFVWDETNLSEEIKKYETENASLIIKIITILGGLLGSSFLVSFISIIFQLNKNQNFILGFGILLIAAAVLASRFSKLLIFDTIFISTLLWGIMLVVVSSSSLKLSERWVSLDLLIIGIFTMVLTKNGYQKLVAIFILAGSFLWMIQIFHFDWLFHVFIILIVFGLMQIYLHEAKFIASRNFLASFYNPLRIGLIIVFLISLGLISTKSEIKFEVKYSWLSSLPIIAAIVLLMQVLMDRFTIKEKNTRLIIYISALSVLALTIISPAIIGSILVMLLCFYVNYKTGFAIGIISLIYFVCMLYYDLNYSLLIKSEMLITTGVLFGIVYFLSTQKIADYEKK